MPKPKKKNTHPTYEEVAELISDVQEEVLNTQSMVRDVDNRMASKAQLAETEERLLAAIRGIEVRREDLDSLKADVHELSARVARLERK